MLKQQDLKFLSKGVDHFRVFRRENLKLFNKFYQRLEGFFDTLPQNTESKATLASINVRLIKFCKLFLNQFFRLPKYITQTIKIRDPKLHQSSFMAFGIASSRLDFYEDADISSQLMRLTETIGGKDISETFRYYGQSTKTIILYDPQFESGFWNRKKAKDNEEVFIFDGAYILFFSFWLIFSGLFLRRASELIFIYKYLKQTGKFRSRAETVSLNMRIIESLTFISYQGLVSKLPQHSTIFLTSNSFFSELLRVFLLQYRRSGKIIEVLHGIIANPTEIYFKNLISMQKCSDKKQHLLIPQIPDLPELKSLSYEYFHENNVAINTYLNSTLSKNKQIFGSYENYSQSNFDLLNLNPEDTNVVLTLYGGTAIEGDFFQSSGFQIELQILERVKKFFTHEDIEAQIFYVLHPSNINTLNSIDLKLKELDIKLVDNSVFTYFITDYCISNISSCLFELNWLGAKCFSPMIATDDIYSEEYLSQIYYPQVNGMKALEESLFNFLQTCLKTEPVSCAEKFNERLTLVKGSHVT